MNKFFIATLLLALFIFNSSLYANNEASDTLVLKNGQIVQGNIENLADIIVTNGSIEKAKFKFADGSKVPVADVDAIKTGGVTFVKKLAGKSPRFMQVIISGKASLYLWRAALAIPHTSDDRHTNGGSQFVHVITTYNKYDITSYMVEIDGTINSTVGTARNQYGISQPSPIGTYKKWFPKIFAACPSLVALAGSKDFDFRDVENHVKEYNVCVK